MSDLSVDLIGVKFSNPILTASGTFGYGYEVEDLIQLEQLGGIVTKTITSSPSHGNKQPRISESKFGIINSIGLQNVGIQVFIKQILHKLLKFNVPLIVSIAGSSVEEYIFLAKILNKQEGISAIELNLSCPNLHNEIICNDICMMKKIIYNVKTISNIPVIAKLSPLISNITKIALIAQNSGADCLTIANTYPAMTIDVKNLKNKISILKGGLSGPCIKPITLRCVYEVYRHNNIKIPIIGCGGIMNGTDVIEFILAGATAVSIGSASLITPLNLIKIINETKNILIKNKIHSIKQLIGKISY
ncbi:MAG: dihydroorotate dehydrogenase [Endomicrobium sp.]|jgi:dihydroorotate dehydrogenase (NAD+) catalytic subunit|nr:dihydroorotate dehydrogenase [Endomicrobium sp.]